MGKPAELELVIDVLSTDAVKVKSGARILVDRCNENWCAFGVKDRKAQRRQVAVGHRSDFEAEVRRGLVEGEGVVLYPTEQLKDGGRVEVR